MIKNACTRSLTLLLGGLALHAGALAQGSMLRVHCEGENLGAEVTVNGQFKGECPIDLQISAGSVLLQAVKRHGGERESRFEQEFRLGDGVVKRLELHLDAPQYTQKGRELEAARLQREREAQQRAAAEQALQKERMLAQARLALEQQVDSLLAETRAWRTGSDTPDNSNCPDCPRHVRPGVSPKEQHLPLGNDAQTNAWIGLLENEINDYIASDGMAFQPPGTAGDWPCPDAQAQTRAISGFVDMAPAQLEEYRRALAAMGTGANFYYRDVRLWPVQMACKNGMLDGPQDVWAFALQVSDNTHHLSVTPMLKHLVFQAQSGKVSGPLRISSRMGGAATRYKDAALQALMQKNRPLRQAFLNFQVSLPGQPDNLRAATAMLALFEDPKLSALPDGPSNSSITLPLGGGRAETIGYNGARKASRSLTRNGKNHGETVIYAYKIPTGLLLPDLQIPGMVQCWNNGTLVTTNPCNVD